MMRREQNDLQIEDLQLWHSRQHLSAKFGSEGHAQTDAIEIQPLQVLMQGESGEEVVGDGGFEYGLRDLGGGREMMSGR